MNLEEMKERKRILGYSNETLARLSGVPLGTVQKVMAGMTRSPRQKTLEALARALSAESGCVAEAAPVYQVESRKHTMEDIRALPEGIRAELIDGQIYYMAAPSRTHQRIVGEMHFSMR